jgi:predicted ATPase
MTNVYPDLARFLGLPLEVPFAEQDKHLDAEGLRQRLFVAIRGWIEQLAQRGPLIISFSDMHWCDATSLDLLRYCLPLCEDANLLWLFVFRPERHAPVWEFWHYVETEYPHRLTTSTLEPLDADSSHTLIEQMIGPQVLPAETEALIIQKAEGNPFYVQELVRSLVASGVLVRESTATEKGEQAGIWRVTQAVTSLSLPDSLQSLLMARIDRLGHYEQLVLQRAAVIGTTFWSRVLSTISPDIPDLRDHLTALQRAQLIAERGRGPDLGVEYMFESKLVRDAAYDSLLSPQRTALHLAIAECLETDCGQAVLGLNQDLYWGALAYHYERARRADKELLYTLKNAEHAQAIFANAEASQQYTHALALLDRVTTDRGSPMPHKERLRQRFRVLLGRRNVYYLMAQFDKMQQDAQELIGLARELEDEPAMLIDALLHQPGVGDYQSQAEIEAGISIAQEALTLSRAIGDRARELQSLICIVNQRLTLSDPSWQSIAEEALELARAAGERYYEARLLVGLGGIYAFSDQPERGMEYLEAAAALAMSQGLEDRVVQMSLLNLLGLEFERSGDYYRLLTEYQQERLHASREIGHRPMESQALQACGRIIGIYLGDYAAALDALRDSQQLLARSPDIVYPLFHVAQIQIWQADLEGATETLRVIESAGAVLQDRGQASLSLIEVMLCNAKGVRSATRSDSAGVIEALQRAVQLCTAVIDLARRSTLVSRQYEMAALCQATVAYLGLAQSLPDETEAQLALALESAEMAYAIYQSFGFAQVVECVSEEVLLRYSQALSANDQQDLALRYLRRAYDEMMRKSALIPADSHYRRTYLEHIPLHREIRAAYTSRIGSILTDSGQSWPQSELVPAL